MSPHLSKQKKTWAAIDELLSTKREIKLDGHSLSIAALVAISRNGLSFNISRSDSVTRRMRESIETLEEQLDEYSVIYGVNTAPGGNADSRTNANSRLQHSFFQHHQSGILPESLLEQPYNSHSLSESMVRAAAVVRCNSLARGHSGIRQDVVEKLARIISQGITPLVPLRGSISASGDLSPLSYLGGVLEGNEDIFVRMKDAEGSSKIISAVKALELLEIPPVTLKPKEGLAIVNGTSVSTGFASLVLHDCHDLAILCQLLTSMAVEALAGKRSNFHPFISEIRPHNGQEEVSRNILGFLEGSKLVSSGDIDSQGLAQDRYAIRTAPQWIGPQLEDLGSAEAQISVELNSTTDNPLIDVQNNCVHHGGNFQAASLTSAMEKARIAITMLGRLLIAQSGELVNPDLNNGLPPNLSADDPTNSFTCKGVDINMAAYYSELAFLTNSVASHVQSAELNNQSVNSLALITSRMTKKATELLAMMSAAHLFMLCQAVDLRARDEDFLHEAKGLMRKEFEDLFSSLLDSAEMSSRFSSLWTAFHSSWQKNNKLEPKARCQQASIDIVSHLFEVFDFSDVRFQDLLQRFQKWQRNVSDNLNATHDKSQSKFLKKQSTPSYLGTGTLRLYEFVRVHLKIPFHRGLIDHPPLRKDGGQKSTSSTIGTQITQIFLAIQDKSVVRAMN